MNRLLMMICVVDQGDGDRCASIQMSNGALFAMISTGAGTASHEMLRLLGLNQSEKDVVFSFVRRDASHTIMDKLTYNMSMIGFSVPMKSAIGMAPLREQPAEANRAEVEGESMETRYSVVVVVANRGHMGQVMDAARKAGATGGTLIHARGAGAHAEEKFFGVSISEEKEMIFIVTDCETRAKIMREIMHDAGVHTKAKAMAFSLPVLDIAGFTNLD